MAPRERSVGGPASGRLAMIDRIEASIELVHRRMDLQQQIAHAFGEPQASPPQQPSPQLQASPQPTGSSAHGAGFAPDALAAPAAPDGAANGKGAPAGGGPGGGGETDAATSDLSKSNSNDSLFAFEAGAPPAKRASRSRR